MQLTHLTLLLSMTLTLSSTQKLTPNAVASLLQGILSPKNTEQAIQMISSAANKKRALTGMPGTVTRRYALTDNVPRTAKTEAQNKITHLIQNPKEMCMKKNVVVQNSNNVIVQRGGNQMVLPKNMVVKQRAQQVIPKNVVVQRRPEMVLPKNVVIQNGEAVMPRNVIVRQEMPKMLVQNDFTPVPQIRPEVQRKVLVSQPQMTEYMTVPQQKVLVRNENSFLPAASPISALTASSALPPAMPKSRGQFLRKIPIPPPTL